jgi:phage terminase small subunit
MPLTPRRQRFVDEYLIDLDAGAAARRAGFSPRSKSYPPRLMRDPDVARAIAQAMAARAARCGITRERVLEEYAKIAFVDLRHLVEWDGDGAVFKNAASVPEEIAAAIALVAELEAGDPAPDREPVFRVTIFDKLKALDALARLIDPHWNADVLAAPPPLPDRLH